MPESYSNKILERLKFRHLPTKEDPLFFGYKLGTWSTAISLLFSIGAFAITAYKFFAPAYPGMFAPSAVELRCWADKQSGLCDPTQYIYIVAASIVWTNRTESGKSYVVHRTYADLTFFRDKHDDATATKTITLIAESFDDSEAVPMQISAQQFVAHRTTFDPRRDKEGKTSDFLLFKDFRSAIAAGETRRIRMKFYSVIDSMATVDATCDYLIDDDVLANFDDPKRRYAQRSCFPVG